MQELMRFVLAEAISSVSKQGLTCRDASKGKSSWHTAVRLLSVP